ncbi:MAG: DUF366 family protein, partial [Planctomycetota bacterium]
LRNFNVRGDSIVVFTGPMDIDPSRIADLEDLLEGDEIRSPLMLHFIVEIFQASLESTVLMQRLLIRLAADRLVMHGVAGLTVSGDDLYIQDSKLSVSIAAPSPVSCMIHLGLNIETEGVPVKAIGLRELGIEAGPFGEEVARAWTKELESIRWAISKVRAIP